MRWFEHLKIASRWLVAFAFRLLNRLAYQV